MATRASIAAKDRKVKEQEIAEKKRQFNKSYKLDKQMQPYKQMESASNTTKNLFQAAYGKGGLAGTLSSASKSNDPAWYKKFGLDKFSASLPTFYRLGSEVAKNWRTFDTMDAVPGIAVIRFIPTLPNQWRTNTPGYMGYKTSPINQSLTRFMAELRKLNSRIGEYDPADLGLYWYAIIGILMPLCNLEKAIRGYNTYYSTNQYLSRMFIKSCGFDVDDFYAHIAEYKATLIRYISLFNANVVLPKSFDFIKRYAWLSSVVVRDHKCDFSQLYHFECPVGLRLSDDEEYVSITKFGGDYTFMSYVNAMDAQIADLFNSVGIVTMTADLRAAFKDGTTLTYGEFRGDETLEFSDSIHDLEQIHNLRTLPSSNAEDGFAEVISGVLSSDGNVDYLQNLNIIQDDEGYLFQGKIVSGTPTPILYNISIVNGDILSCCSKPDNNYLNFYDSEFISEDSILEATRLRAVLYSNGLEGASGRAFAINGTEIVTDIIIIQADTSDPDPYMYSVSTDHDLDAGPHLDLTPVSTEVLAMVTTFDWMPWFNFVAVDESEFQYVFGEMDHIVRLTNSNLMLLHDACAYSLFYISDFASGHVA